ncbi:MAG: hypothetical protein OEU92_25015 [Alphaproteobacteria bacterium]|nr:hypothetical protein [Alphaproteobacteria bacterium]
MQMLQKTLHYLFGFASTFPFTSDRYEWIDALGHEKARIRSTAMTVGIRQIVTVPPETPLSAGAQIGKVGMKAVTCRSAWHSGASSTNDTNRPDY